MLQPTARRHDRQTNAYSCVRATKKSFHLQKAINFSILFPNYVHSVPHPPENVRIDRVSSSSIDVTWTTPPGSYTGYRYRPYSCNLCDSKDYEMYDVWCMTFIIWLFHFPTSTLSLFTLKDITKEFVVAQFLHRWEMALYFIVGKVFLLNFFRSYHRVL